MKNIFLINSKVCTWIHTNKSIFFSPQFYLHALFLQRKNTLDGVHPPTTADRSLWSQDHLGKNLKLLPRPTMTLKSSSTSLTNMSNRLLESQLEQVDKVEWIQDVA
jgi:hypothetical protein